ncbi:MAG: hypothetical protein AMXMBFR33_46570 [Candidatus Xenobia bacterium]
MILIFGACLVLCPLAIASAEDPRTSAPFLLVANTDRPSVSVSRVAPDGSLSQVAGSPFSTPNRPSELLMMGEFLLVANSGSGAGSNSLSTFRYDDSTGRLTQARTLPLGSDVPQVLSGIPVDDRTVVFAQGLDGVLKCFHLDPAGGSLTETDSVAISGSGTNDTTVARGANGHPSFVLASNTETNDISVYLVDPARGTLTEVPGSPFPNPQAGDMPGSIFSIEGNVYITNQVANSISRLLVDPATGNLTPLGMTPCGGVKPGGMTTLVAPSGSRTLYVCNSGSSSISAFDIGARGELLPVSGFPIPAGGNDPREFSILTLENGRVVLYVSTSEQVFGFDLDLSTRFLMPLASSPFGGFSSPNAMSH